jgi:prephenate dehydrogenase
MTICGVGLIGGSLAMAARREGLVERIVGFGRGEANLKVAIDRKIIDVATRDPAIAAHGADLVVLATPIRSLAPTLKALVPNLPANAVITDVGSVKQSVIEALEPLLGPAMALVAAHPIAGRETTGAGAADADLFVGARVIITPSRRSTHLAIDAIERMWRATGARVEQLPADVHDALLARASHLPQLCATALAAALEDATVDDRWVGDYGAGGLRDTTRLAASSADMWVDICLTNRAAILDALSSMNSSLGELTRMIERGDEAGLRKIFERGARMRRRLSGESA